MMLRVVGIVIININKIRYHVLYFYSLLQIDVRIFFNILLKD
jgi:hypothetical protein